MYHSHGLPCALSYTHGCAVYTHVNALNTDTLTSVFHSSLQYMLLALLQTLLLRIIFIICQLYAPIRVIPNMSKYYNVSSERPLSFHTASTSTTFSCANQLTLTPTSSTCHRSHSPRQSHNPSLSLSPLRNLRLLPPNHCFFPYAPHFSWLPYPTTPRLPYLSHVIDS